MKKTHKTNGTVIDYAYDNLGNILQVRNSKGSTVDYTVDGMDRRIVKKVSGVFADGYIYQDFLRPAAQLNANGSVRALFVYGTRFNSPDIIIKGGVTYRVVHDHVGSPIYVINTSNSSVAQKITYDAWGNILSDSNPGFQ
ncbi:hypothetical protein OEZ78_26425, partial [Leclercia adecarboxylata]|uniref:hypothetical protein n=1 Tax=Leclercia adecarboxylata TaxID=83655 RepID=UPI00234C8B62